MGIAVFSNNAETTIAAQLLIGGASVQVALGHGDDFPIVENGNWSKITLRDDAGNLEIVKCTARALGSDVLMIDRAQEGTAARQWEIDDIASHRLTASELETLSNNYTAARDAETYGGLEAAVATIGATEATLKITTPQALTGDLAIPATLSVEIEKGGEIDQGVHTFTCGGFFDAGNYQVFTGTGAVVFADGSTIKSAWFSAINVALTSLGDTQKIIFRLTQDEIMTANKTVENNITWEADPDCMISAGAAFTLTIKGLIRIPRQQWIAANVTLALHADALQRFDYPEWWGIDGTNDEVQLSLAGVCMATAANASVQSAGIVDLDAKPYICNAAINATYSNVYFQGKGRSTVIRRTNGGVYNSFYFAPADTVNDQIYNVGLKDLSVQATDNALTGGSLVRLKSVHWFELENIRLQDGFINLRLDGSNGGLVTNLNSYFGSLLGAETANTWHIYIDKGDHAIVPTIASVFFDNFNLTGSADHYVNGGIALKSADGVWFTNGHIFRVFGSDLYIDPTANQTITGSYFNHIFFDACGKADNSAGYGVHFAAVSAAAYQNFEFNHCTFFGGGGARGKSAFYVNTATPKNISITNCDISGWHNHGINFNLAASQFAIKGNKIYDCNEGDGGSSGILLVDGCSDFSVQNNEIGRTTDTIPLARGIIAGTAVGCDDFIISGNLIKGCTSNLIAAPSPSAWSRIENNADDAEGSTIASVAALTLPVSGGYFVISGTASITSIAASWAGRTVKLMFTGTAAAAGLTDGNNLKIAGNFGYTPDDTVTLTCDGTNWYEDSRSVN